MEKMLIIIIWHKNKLAMKITMNKTIQRINNNKKMKCNKKNNNKIRRNKFKKHKYQTLYKNIQLQNLKKHNKSKVMKSNLEIKKV